MKLFKTLMIGLLLSSSVTFTGQTFSNLVDSLFDTQKEETPKAAVLIVETPNATFLAIPGPIDLQTNLPTVIPIGAFHCTNNQNCPNPALCTARRQALVHQIAHNPTMIAALMALSTNPNNQS